MNRRADYDSADWSLSDVELGEMLGVTKQAVQAARRVRGIPSAVGHGGCREGAGRKPRTKTLGDGPRTPRDKKNLKIGRNNPCNNVSK